MIRVLDRAQAVAFGLLGLGCIYGAIAKGAWWHIGTAVICAVMAVALWKSATPPCPPLRGGIVDEGEVDLE